MPQYNITAPNGRVITITGDKPPTEQELDEIFAQIPQQQMKNNLQDIAEQQRLREFAEDKGTLGTIGTGFTRGLNTLGQGLENLTGLDLPLTSPFTEQEQKEWEALEEYNPISAATGEILGEAAPFLIPGGAVARVGSMAGRIGAGAGLGAVEGGLLAAGRGEDIASGAGTGAAIAGTMEAVLPVFGRIAKDLYQKVSGKTVTKVTDEAGNLLPDVENTLRSAGFNPEEIQGKAVNLVHDAAKTADEAERIARFRKLGIEYTPGDVTGDFSQRSKEARLLELQDEPLAEGLRQKRIGQAERIEELKTQLVNQLGDPDTEILGKGIKQALGEAETLTREQRKDLYQQLSEAAGYSGGVPLSQERIFNTLTDDIDFSGMVNVLSDQERDTLSGMMVKYGIDNSPEMIEQFTQKTAGPVGLLSKRNEITPLTTQNAEQFSKDLNAMLGPQSSDALRGVIGKIKRSVDSAFNDLDDQILGEDLINLKQAARGSNIELKTKFSPESMVGRLTNVKRDGYTPIVEASNVYNQILRPGKTSTLEPLSRVMDQLERTPKGKQAIKDLQAKVVFDVLEKGFAESSDRISGQVLFSGNKAAKHIKDLGTKELERLFKNNQGALKQLDNIVKAGIDITPSKKEVLKGSASAISNIVNKVAGIPGLSQSPILNAFATSFESFARAGKDRKQLKKMIDNSPKLKQQAKIIKEQMPRIATYLGITGIEEENE